jgi:hypothetical protein
MPATLPVTPPAENAGSSFARRGLRTAVVGLLVAAVFSLVFAKDFVRSVAYAVSIAVCCWFFIDGGRLLAARWLHRRHGSAFVGGSLQWPGWGPMAGVIVLGTVLGYTVGNTLANWITGGDSPGIVTGSPRQALMALLISLIPGIAATYYFFSRERLAATEAKALRAERAAAEYQLRLLESQLEPHMLFNTLANLRVLIGIDPPRAQAMLDQLIGFLRATLNASRVGRHALSAEYSRLADYLALMQVRMGERLQVRLDLPEALAGVAVPPLLLQPLVENCIKHGLEPKVAGGRIEVSAAREGDTLALRIRDTGVGLAAPAGEGTKFGLAQVRERLATLYGERASLTLADVGDTDGGALATVRLPFERSDAQPT